MSVKGWRANGPGDEIPTDNLRDAYQRNRSFFERFLTPRRDVAPVRPGGASRQERRSCRRLSISSCA